MTDALLAETVAEMLAEVCTDDALRAAERDGFAPRAWAVVADAGLPWISVPEFAGGEGGELADALAVLRTAGYYGLPLPLAETGVLGGWLLAAASLPVGRVPTTIARGPELSWAGSTVRGRARLVPWGRSAGQVVTLVAGGGQDVVAVFDPADLRVEPHVNLAGEPRDTLYFDGAAPLASAPIELAAAASDADADTADAARAQALLRRRGALTRVMLMAGAAERIRDITVRYVGERHQFGKPIGRFPGVQQHVVLIAQQAAALAMAADLAAAAATADPWLSGPAAAFRVPAAKSIAADATAIATAAAHQAHGAMGMTQEYSLHHLTRRMWAWTREYGTGAKSAAETGALAARAGADALWPLIAAGGDLGRQEP